MRAPLTYIPTVRWLDAGTLSEGPDYRVLRPHGTSDYLLIFSRAGRGRFGTEDGGELAAEPGIVTLIAPGTPHDYGVEASLQHWEIAYCHFHPRSEWSVLLDWPQPYAGLGRLSVGETVGQRIDRQLELAGYYSRSDQPRAEMFGMNALEAALLWCDSQNPRAGQLDERILRVVEHLDRHIAEPLTVVGLAEVAHLSPSRFAHLFAEQVGVPPLAYLERQRMARARQLLDRTTRSVGEVARAVGFDDPLYFSTRFRKSTGCAPTVYRSRG